MRRLAHHQPAFFMDSSDRTCECCRSTLFVAVHAHKQIQTLETILKGADQLTVIRINIKVELRVSATETDSLADSVLCNDIRIGHISCVAIILECERCDIRNEI